MTYLLFAGQDYYPCGGWDDFVGAFDHASSAKARISGASTHVTRPATPAREHVEVFSTTDVVVSTRGQPTALITRQYVDIPAQPERTEQVWFYDWAQLVHDNRVILEWRPDTGWRTP